MAASGSIGTCGRDGLWPTSSRRTESASSPTDAPSEFLPTDFNSSRSRIRVPGLVAMPGIGISAGRYYLHRRSGTNLLCGARSHASIAELCLELHRLGAHALHIPPKSCVQLGPAAE